MNGNSIISSDLKKISGCLAALFGFWLLTPGFFKQRMIFKTCMSSMIVNANVTGHD